jgi:hypothetical protein
MVPERILKMIDVGLQAQNKLFIGKSIKKGGLNHGQSK